MPRRRRGDGFTVDEGAPVAAPTAAPAEQPGEPNRRRAGSSRTQRSIIYTGTMSVRVDNVQDAANRAADVALGLGGLVGADRRTLNDQHSEAQITLRVPADRSRRRWTRSPRSAPRNPGRCRPRTSPRPCSTSMPGSPRSRPASTGYGPCSPAPRPSARSSSVESELTRREAELASLKARKERLADLVALSTITVTLRGPAAPSPEEESSTGFLAGLKSGWEAFLTSVQVVLTVAGWLLPWALAIGLPSGCWSGCCAGGARPSPRPARPYR